VWDTEPLPPQPTRATRELLAPDTTSPAHAAAESALAERLGWNLGVLRGELATNSFGTAGGYRLLAPHRILSGHEPQFEVLRVTNFGRFGNAVRRLRNVFAVARRYRVPRIEFARRHELFGGDRVAEFSLGWTFPWERPAEQQTPGIIGDFYVLHAFGFDTDPGEEAEVTSSCVRPLLPARLRTPRHDVGEDDLILHFRGGDIFGPSHSIHPGYGQPPASYYLSAVAREKPNRVWLVDEDRRNPAIDAVESMLRLHGITVFTQSTTLEGDIHVLLSARRIVAGIGTFVPAIAALSERLRQLTLFEPPVKALRRLGVEQISGRDRKGAYQAAMLSNNWRNTPEQRALMLAYPPTALEFTVHAPA